MKTLLLIIVISLISQGAFAGGLNPSEVYDRLQAAKLNNYQTEDLHQKAKNAYANRSVKQDVKRTIAINPFAWPSAHSEMLERIRKSEIARKEHLARKKSKPVFVSRGIVPPDTDGKLVYNALGTEYCGLNGCWRK